MQSQKESTELNRPKRNPSWLPFVLSMVIHATLTSILLLSPHFSADRLKPAKKTEVELIDPADLLKALKAQNPLKDPKGQIVEQDDKAINDETPEDTKFLSKHNQKIVKETQSAQHGRFKNTNESLGDKKASEKKQAKTEVRKQGVESDQNQIADETEKSKEVLTADNGVPAKGQKPKLKDLLPSFKPAPPPSDSEADTQSGGSGPSATDDSLKNVATGMQTLLSTREFVYYSYYNRIKDKLRQYWEPKIKEKMERIVRQGRTIASNTDRITKIVITLDKVGTLVRVQVIGPSGVTDLDEAAIEAFRAAAPFPNPPKGIVESDGTIKIRWDFILEANATGLMNAFRLARIPN